MSALRLNKSVLKRCKKFKCFSTAVQHDDEYTATPQYPPILDMSPDKIQERKKEALYEEIKAVKTVEEKQIKLNMPKYYGFKSYMLYEDYIPYNSLSLIQHVTRTHLIKNDNLPPFYNDLDVSTVANDVKTDIEEVILVETARKREGDKVAVENSLSFDLSKQINRIIMSRMCRALPHLMEAHVDLNPRVESFWFAGGMNPPENIKRYRRGTEWQKIKENEPTNRGMNYIGSSNLSLRSDLPLRQLISPSDAENPDLGVPHFEFDPRTVGTVANEHRHIANIPGFWPGDSREFGFLSYHKRGHLITRHYNDVEDHKEAIDRQGILASFGWLNAQANYQGFTTFNDITYPFVTQTVVTNGQIWSFYVYQLNTIVNHSKFFTENPKRNVCWGTPEVKLFEGVENDKLIGFNDDVLKMLLKFYANAPEEKLGVNMKPFLGKEEKFIADYEDADKREWLEREYKFLVSNRPRDQLGYEIYAWEKIYKIDHQTRFMDKKRRPFEFKMKPSNRRLDERLPRYIPRALRPHLPRHKGRYAKEYFP
ncbi:28S ribosomal protein S30, mitochondrial isoform X2 [Tribolium madens]|uniref:28S ribosomal protein S30, mitochondrial isoform X2 n=1 Tax=Tribolium madens TaxID=41895 RepID=UPI001CF72B72|nr:28S ribosomal protein S30, mitochondrial isoform X2 [Tribolium madens]